MKNIKHQRFLSAALAWLLLLLSSLMLTDVTAFCSSTSISPPTRRRRIRVASKEGVVVHMGKVWDRLELSSDESEELSKKKEWYIITCIPGGEKDCQSQCREATKNFKIDTIEAFEIPTREEVSSKGNSILANTKKIMYPGYVFAKLKLTPPVYETLMGLSSVRGFMGSSIRHQTKRSYKLKPSVPTPITEEEAVNYGLFSLSKEQQSVANSNATKQESQPDHQFSHLSIGGMVKILNGKHKHEDGIVKKIKDGQVNVRLYAYGSIFDEWFDPSNLKTLTEEQVQQTLLKAKANEIPSEPITQQQFTEQIYSEENNDSAAFTTSISDVLSNLGIKQRNRKQDRKPSAVSEQQQQKLRQERDKWFASTISSQKHQSQTNKKNDDNQFRVNAQWGRPTKQRGDETTIKKQTKPTLDDDYWSNVLTNNELSGDDENDDFFSDLLAELSSGEISDTTVTTTTTEEPQDMKTSSSEDLFFESLEQSLQQREQQDTTFQRKSRTKTDIDSSLFSKPSPIKDNAAAAVDTSLLSSANEEDDDLFFSKLEDELTELLEGGKDMKPSIPSSQQSSREAKQEGKQWNTVKDMKEELKKRGLKVSGSKAELYERLMSFDNEGK